MSKIYRVLVQDVRLFHLDVKANSDDEARIKALNAIDEILVELVEDEESEQGYEIIDISEVGEYILDYANDTGSLLNKLDVVALVYDYVLQQVRDEFATKCRLMSKARR